MKGTVSINSAVEMLRGLRDHFPFSGFERAAFMSRDEIQHNQWKALRRIVNYACVNVPLYQELYGGVDFETGDLKSWDDFRNLPTVTRQMMSENPGAFSRAYNKTDLYHTFSSGSSGKSFWISYDYRAVIAYLLAGLRLYRMGFAYGPQHTHAYVYTSPLPFQSLLGLYRLRYIPTLDETAIIIQKLNAANPHLLAVYPSRLRDMLGHGGLDLTRLRAVSVNSEYCSAAERREWEKQLNCPVLDDYASEELTHIAGECKNGRHHIFEDVNHIEVLQPDSGVGRIVGTNLWNYAMPFIRYEQGDDGHIAGPEAEVCPCGRNFKILSEFKGRRNDAFQLPSGRSLSSGYLLDLMYKIFENYPNQIADFNLIQKRKDLIRLELDARPDLLERDIGEIRGLLLAKIKEPVHIEVKVTDEVYKHRRGKRNPIQCLLKSENKSTGSLI